MARQLITASPLFERFAQGATFRDRIAIAVHASPEEIFDAMRSVTMRDMPVARTLGAIRYLPARWRGHVASPIKPFWTEVLETGNVVLADDSPREVITGLAAELDRANQHPRTFSSPAAFDAFNDPACQKLFMSLRVAPTGRQNEHWLVLEHATRALSPESARRFAGYWRVIKPLGALASQELLRAIRRKAERASRSVRATDAERSEWLPGDILIAGAATPLTHAVTIERPPQDVWPWLAQMGAGSRAGWYSYDLVDNGRKPSAMQVVPELQQLKSGMTFPALPGVPDVFTLLAFDPDDYLVLGWLRTNVLVMTWAFVLRAIGPGTCRLIVRARTNENYRIGRWPVWLTAPLGRALHFVMQRKQLLGIKRRAESLPARPVAPSRLPGRESKRAA